MLTWRNKATTALRWVAVLPAAILGCLVARVLIVLLNRITMAGHVDPDSFLARVFLEWVGSLIMGVAAVYIGWYVAPAYKLHTAIIVAGLVLLVSGALLFAALLQRDYWAIFATIAMNFGSIATAYETAARHSKLTADDETFSDEETRV